MRSTRRRTLILKQLYITMLCNIRLQRRIQNVLAHTYCMILCSPNKGWEHIVFTPFLITLRYFFFYPGMFSETTQEIYMKHFFMYIICRCAERWQFCLNVDVCVLDFWYTNFEIVLTFLLIIEIV